MTNTTFKFCEPIDYGYIDPDFKDSFISKVEDYFRDIRSKVSNAFNRLTKPNNMKNNNPYSKIKFNTENSLSRACKKIKKTSKKIWFSIFPKAQQQQLAAPKTQPKVQATIAKAAALKVEQKPEALEETQKTLLLDDNSFENDDAIIIPPSESVSKLVLSVTVLNKKSRTPYKWLWENGHLSEHVPPGAKPVFSFKEFNDYHGPALPQCNPFNQKNNGKFDRDSIGEYTNFWKEMLAAVKKNGNTMSSSASSKSQVAKEQRSEPKHLVSAPVRSDSVNNLLAELGSEKYIILDSKTGKTLFLTKDGQKHDRIPQGVRQAFKPDYDLTDKYNRILNSTT